MSSDQSLLPLKPPRWHRWPRWPAFQECTPRNQCPTESHGRWWLWWQMAGSQKAEKTILCVKILLDFFKTIHIYITSSNINSVLNERTAASSESVDAAELTAWRLPAGPGANSLKQSVSQRSKSHLWSIRTKKKNHQVQRQEFHGCCYLCAQCASTRKESIQKSSTCNKSSRISEAAVSSSLAVWTHSTHIHITWQYLTSIHTIHSVWVNFMQVNQGVTGFPCLKLEFASRISLVTIPWQLAHQLDHHVDVDSNSRGCPPVLDEPCLQLLRLLHSDVVSPPQLNHAPRILQLSRSGPLKLPKGKSNMLHVWNKSL